MRSILLSVMAAPCLLPAIAGAQSIPAYIPLEAMAPDPALSSGQIAINGQTSVADSTIAAQPMRIARGVVREGEKAEVLALTLLNGETTLEGAPENHAWCELPTSMSLNLWSRYAVDCFQDRDGDGAFETKYFGRLASFAAVQVLSLDSPKPVRAAAYRAATAAELPIWEVGYQSCASQAEKSAADVKDFRFGTMMREQGKKMVGFAQCLHVGKLLETRADGERIVQFDRFKVGVRERDGRLLTRLIDGIPPGTILANLRVDRLLTDLGTKPEQGLPAKLEDVAKPSLYLTGIPDTRSTAALNETFLTADVALGITGKLRSDLKTTGLISKQVFAAGTPVFGAVMKGAVTTGMTGPVNSTTRDIESFIAWCAPYRDPLDYKKRLTSQCFAPGAYGYMVYRNDRPFEIIELSSATKGVEMPIVDRGDVDLGGPLQMRLRLERVKSDEVLLQTSVSFIGKPEWRSLTLRRGVDDVAKVALGGAVLYLRPGADRKSVQVQFDGEFKIGADANLVDLTRYAR